MTLNSSRREFFNKFLGGKSAQKFITPPYFSNEFDCADCKAPCVNVCDEKLLSFENNQVKLNGKPFTIQPDEDILADIEADDSPSSASVPATQSAK